MAVLLVLAVVADLFFRRMGKVNAIGPEESNRANQTPPSAEAPASESSDEKICPMCAEKVKVAAKKCKHCGHLFDIAEISLPKSQVPPVERRNPTRRSSVVRIAIGVTFLITVTLLAFSAYADQIRIQEQIQAQRSAEAARVAAINQQIAENNSARTSERSAQIAAQEAAQAMRAKSAVIGIMAVRKIGESEGYDQWLVQLQSNFTNVIVELEHGKAAPPIFGAIITVRAYRRDNLLFSIQQTNRETGAQWNEDVYLDVYRVIQ